MAWLGSLFSGIAAMLASGMASKTVFTAALVAGFLALTAAFVATVHSAASALYGSLPSWAIGIGYLIPDNAAACFSCLLSARIARWIYDYHYDVIKSAVTA
jgi:hypothetical protein